MKNRAPCKTCNRDAIPPPTTKKGFKVLQYYMWQYYIKVQSFHVMSNGVEFSCFVKLKVKSKQTVYSQSTKISSRNLLNINQQTTLNFQIFTKSLYIHIYSILYIKTFLNEIQKFTKSLYIHIYIYISILHIITFLNESSQCTY